VRIFSEAVPYTSRATFHHDLRSAGPTGVYLGIISLLAMYVKKSLHAPDWQVAMLISAPVAGHLFSFYWGYLCNRRRKMPYVMWPGLVSRGLYLGVGLFSNSLVLVVLASLGWFIDCISFPPASAIYRANYPGTHRYRAVSLVTLIRNLAMALSGLVAGWILAKSEWNYHWLFPLGGLVGMSGVLLFARIKVRGERDLAEVAGEAFCLRDVWTSMVKSMGLLFKDRPFGLYMLVQFVFSWFWLMTDPALIKLLNDDMKISWSEAGMLLVTVKSLAVMASLVVWGHLLHRLGPFRGRLLTCSLIAIGLTLVVLAKSIALIFVAQAVLGIAGAGGGLLWNLAQMHFGSKEDMSLYTGAHATLTGVRGVTAPFACAWLLSWMSPRDVFMLATGAYLVTIVMLVVMLVYKLDEPAEIY